MSRLLERYHSDGGCIDEIIDDSRESAFDDNVLYTPCSGLLDEYGNLVFA